MAAHLHTCRDAALDLSAAALCPAALAPLPR